MFQRVVPDVLKLYDVRYVSVGEPQKGYRNESYAVELADGSLVNLIFFKREPQILARVKRADAASRWAATQGLPVRTRFDERLMNIRTNSYAGLYTYLPGYTIAWEMYSMKHIKLLGWAMAELHASLADMEPPDDYSVYDELTELIGRMERYFGRTDVQQATYQKLGVSVASQVAQEARRAVNELRGSPGQQMLHMDMVRGNVLFDKALLHDRWRIGDTALTGVIDFEKAAYGHPVCDVARTLAFLLVDCTKPAAKTYKYFLESGYLKRGGVELACGAQLEPLVKLFLFHDFYKFLRHTPYESLAKNHHYVRTRDLLKKYGMISLKS